MIFPLMSGLILLVIAPKVSPAAANNFFPKSKKKKKIMNAKIGYKYINEETGRKYILAQVKS
jgi:hypothetical protein